MSGAAGGHDAGSFEQVMAQWASGSALTLDVRIDRKDIVRFAVATGARQAVHHDPEAARAAGFPDLVAPPMFYVALRTSVFNLVPIDQLHPEGTPLRDAPPVPFTQAMAGETVAELARPFVAGELVRCSRRVESFERKSGRSGPLTFVRFGYRYADLDDELIAAEHFTRIFR